MLAVGYRRFGTTYRPSIKVSSSPRPLTETRAAWRSSTAETSTLPVAEIVAWVVLERRHVEHWWNDANRWQHKYSPRYSFQCQFVHHKPHNYWPGTSSSVHAVTPAMIYPTRQLVEDVHDASRVISHKNKTIIVRHLPKAETVPKQAQDCSLLKICNPMWCKPFRSYLRFFYRHMTCDTSSLLCTKERPSFLFVAYRSSSPPGIP